MNETFDGLIEIIRKPRLDLFKTYTEIADRLKSAHEREVARLNAALKPVLECNLGSPNQMAAWGAVREAQRIYKEGEAK